MKTVTSNNLVDLEREERIKKYDRLLEELGAMTKSRRMTKIVESPGDNMGISERGKALYNEIKAVFTKCNIPL